MKIYLGADHAGYKLKEKIKGYLESKKISFEDLGNKKYNPIDDYPDYASKVAKKVSLKKGMGILICGNGVGVCIAANKFKGVRAVNASNMKIAKESRADDDTNVLCLAGRHISEFQAKKIINTWLNTKFKKATKYKRRINKIKKLEK